VRVAATSVNFHDIFTRRGMPGVRISLPVIVGSDIAGTVVEAGAGVDRAWVGKRVLLDPVLRTGPRVGMLGETFHGGRAELVAADQAMLVEIPDGVSFEQASFIEPVNTCMKGVETLRLMQGETALVIGQGPIGIILSVLARRCGARVITSDLYPQRLTITKTFGLNENIDASTSDTVSTIKHMTEGRGADAVLLAVAGNGLIKPAMDAARPGGRVLLFAQTQHGEAIIDPAGVCVDEKSLLGSYSASVDLQDESARFVLDREMDLEKLISHRFTLTDSIDALQLAAHPKPDSMKVVIQPGSLWKES